MSTADKMSYLLETKSQIKNAIVNKGIEVAETDSFRSYAEKIGSIETGGSTIQDEFYNLRTINGTSGQGLFGYLPVDVQNNPEMISFIEDLDTSNMTRIDYMFNMDSYIINLDLSNWNVSKVTTMNYMFGQCTNLTSLDLSSWRVNSVMNLSYFLYSCSKIESLNIENWDTSKVTSLQGIFNGCNKLVTVLGIIDMINVTAINYMFGVSGGCSALETIYLKNLNVTGLNLIKTVSLTHESLMYLINNLVPTITAKTINLGATNLDKLTDEEKAIAVEAGWTLA